jgi:hypothetical protein
MDDWSDRIRTCVFVGSPESSFLNISLAIPHLTITYVAARPLRSDALWSSLGFASETEFTSVQNQVDLVVAFFANGAPTLEDIGRIGEILEHVCGMDVIVMLAVVGYMDILERMQSMPIVAWLEARIMIWRRLPGGVVISHGNGKPQSRVASEMVGLMQAAGTGVVTRGVECLAGGGPVAVPLESGPFVLVGASGVELGQSLRWHASLVAAVLVDSRLAEIPVQAFIGSDGLALVGLPRECATIRPCAFYVCGALSGIDMENVEVVECWSFKGCYDLSHIGGHSRVRTVGSSAFRGSPWPALSLNRLPCWVTVPSRGAA